MPDLIIAEVKGLKELAEALKQLPQKLAGKALGSTVKAAADFIRDAARANVPIDTGAVKKSLVSYRKRGSTEKDMTYQVGVTMQKKYPKGGKRKGLAYILWGSNAILPPYYWRFVEFGTVKKGARPFLRPAFDYRSGEALAIIKKMLAAEIEKAADQVPKYRG